MEVVYKSEAVSDIKYWKRVGDKKIQKRIELLIEDIRQHPETGLGKPEQLKYELSGRWSRRIDQKNRIVYRIQDDEIQILSLRGHYEK